MGRSQRLTPGEDCHRTDTLSRASAPCRTEAGHTPVCLTPSMTLDEAEIRASVS